MMGICQLWALLLIVGLVFVGQSIAFDKRSDIDGPGSRTKPQRVVDQPQLAGIGDGTKDELDSISSTSSGTTSASSSSNTSTSISSTQSALANSTASLRNATYSFSNSSTVLYTSSTVSVTITADRSATSSSAGSHGKGEAGKNDVVQGETYTASQNDSASSPPSLSSRPTDHANLTQSDPPLKANGTVSSPFVSSSMETEHTSSQRLRPEDSVSLHRPDLRNGSGTVGAGPTATASNKLKFDLGTLNESLRNASRGHLDWGPIAAAQLQRPNTTVNDNANITSSTSTAAANATSSSNGGIDSIRTESGRGALNLEATDPFFGPGQTSQSTTPTNQTDNTLNGGSNLINGTVDLSNLTTVGQQMSRFRRPLSNSGLLNSAADLALDGNTSSTLGINGSNSTLGTGVPIQRAGPGSGVGALFALRISGLGLDANGSLSLSATCTGTALINDTFATRTVVTTETVVEEETAAANASMPSDYYITPLQPCTSQCAPGILCFLQYTDNPKGKDGIATPTTTSTLLVTKKSIIPAPTDAAIPRLFEDPQPAGNAQPASNPTPPPSRQEGHDAVVQPSSSPPAQASPTSVGGGSSSDNTGSSDNAGSSNSGDQANAKDVIAGASHDNSGPSNSEGPTDNSGSSNNGGSSGNSGLSDNGSSTSAGGSSGNGGSPGQVIAGTSSDKQRTSGTSDSQGGTNVGSNTAANAGSPDNGASSNTPGSSGNGGSSNNIIAGAAANVPDTSNNQGSSDTNNAGSSGGSSSGNTGSTGNGGSSNSGGSGGANSGGPILGNEVYVPNKQTIGNVPVQVGAAGVVIGDQTVQPGPSPTQVIAGGQTFQVGPSQVSGNGQTIPLKQAIAQPAAAASFNAGDQPVALNANNVVIAGNTYDRGSSPTNVVDHGNTYSWNGDQFFGPGVATPFPVMAGSQTPAVTAGGQSFNVHNNFLQAPGTNIAIPQPGRTSQFEYNSQSFTVDHSRLVAADQNVQLPAATPPAKFMYDGQTFSYDASHLYAGSNTASLSASSGTYNYNGQILHLASDQVVGPTTTIPIQPGQAVQTSGPLASVDAGGHNIQIGAGRAIVGTNTYDFIPGAPLKTVEDHGEQVTVGPDGVKYGGVNIPRPTQPPTYSVTSADGATYSLAPSEVVVNGQTISVPASDQSPITTSVNGKEVQIGPQGIVVPGSGDGGSSKTIVLPTPSPTYSVVTKGSLTLSVASNAAVVDETTLTIDTRTTASPSTRVIDGETLVLGPSGVRIKGATVSLPATSERYVPVTISAANNLVVSVGDTNAIIDGKTYAIGGGATPTAITLGSGQVLSLGTAGIAIPSLSTTIAPEAALETVTADGQVILVGPTEAIVGGSTYAIGTAATSAGTRSIILNGPNGKPTETIAIGPSGVILSSTTIAPKETPTPTTVAGLSFSADASEVVLNGTTYDIGSAAITGSGSHQTVVLGDNNATTLTVGTDGIVYGSTTIQPWTNTATATATSSFSGLTLVPSTVSPTSSGPTATASRKKNPSGNGSGGRFQLIEDCLSTAVLAVLGTMVAMRLGLGLLL